MPTLKGLLSRVKPRAGHYLSEVAQDALAGKISAQAILDTYESQGHAPGAVAEVIARFPSLPDSPKICEVGAGTGVYTRAMLERYPNAQVEVYEIEKVWRRYLAQIPNVIARPCDGLTLASTATQSVNLVCAHGVFVYLSFLSAAQNLSELARVCAPDGFVVFDFYDAARFDDAMLKAWMSSPHRYVMPLSRAWVAEFFAARGFELCAQWQKPWCPAPTDYIVFRRVAD